MRKEIRKHLSFEEDVIALSLGERETLRRASRIAEQLRELAREIGPDFESDGVDTSLAEIEHNARDIADDGYVSVATRDYFGTQF